jgi:cob(I)alamin adenosyltransferase
MKIYTKKGDGGETSLSGGTRVQKSSVRIEAYGCVDELNSLLGVVRSLKPPADLESILYRLQQDLFVLGADLASPRRHEAVKTPRMHARHYQTLEGYIDHLDSELELLSNFILPGGTVVAAQLHVARAVCRRAERSVVRLSREEEIGTEPVVYLNRLSDLLFVMARFANRQAGVDDIRWVRE